MNPSRMIQLTGSYPPRVCGIADYTSNLVKALGEQGCPMAVWTRLPYADHPEATGFAENPGTGGMDRLIESIRATRPALVHLQFERAVWDENPAVCTALPMAIKRSGARLVTTFHSLDGPLGWGRLSRAALLPLLALTDDVLVCSRKQLSAVSRLPGVARKASLTPIGNVIPVTGVRSPRPPGSPIRLVYFGFLWKGRNIETLLRALHAVAAAGIDATLTLAGAVKEPSYRAALEHLACSLRVDDRVRFLGESGRDGDLSGSRERRPVPAAVRDRRLDGPNDPDRPRSPTASRWRP